MTKTNFFSELQKLNVKHFSISLLFDENDNVTVSILPITKAKDNATKLKPIVISAEIKEMDEHFFKTIKENLINTSLFFSNVEKYEEKLTIQKNETEEKKALKEKIKKVEDKLLKIVNEENFDVNQNKTEILKLCKELIKFDEKNKLALKWNKDIINLTNTLF